MNKVNAIRKTSGAIMLSAGMMFFFASCDKDNDPKPDNKPGGNKAAIELSCDYFETDRVLTDDPEAPVDYIIPCEARVYAKLTVEPGVVIAFKPKAALFVEKDASLTMNGTAAKPIILTGVEKEKGLWNGVLIESIKASNSMKYVTIEYAGSQSVSHSGGVYPAGLQVIKDGDVKIDHCTFQHCKDNGLFWSSSNYISITNSTFTKNDVPMMTTGWNQIKLYNNTNSYKGNVNDYVHMQYPGISYDQKKITWHKIDVPYYITTRIYNRFDVDHAQLVIEPGTDIIMATAETHIRIMKDASITAVGTESDPIIFRGKNDVKAAWGYIHIYKSGSSLNEIAHAKIQNTGGSLGNIQAAVQLEQSSYLKLHHVDFTNNAGYAVGMLYSAAMPYPVLDYDNLTVDNNKKFCKGANGSPLADPNDPNS